MIIKTVEFAGAIARPGGAAPGDLRQIAFSGRSNVGKSSLINRLLGRTRSPIAKVSATPGKTQQINFFNVRARPSAAASARDLEFFLVDLPGYGYAQVPLAVRASWKPLIERYLVRNERLAGVVQLIDARRGATPDDERMIGYLAESGVPALFVLTKVDKLRNSERPRLLARVSEQLGVGPEQVLPFSARTGEGRESLVESVEALLVEDEADGSSAAVSP